MRRSTTALIAAPFILFTLACATSGTGTTGHKLTTGSGPSVGFSTATTKPAATTPPAAKTTAPAAPATDKTQTFSGSSDKLIKLTGLSSDRLHVARLTYKGSSNFIVNTIDGDGQEVNNLANAIGHYTGDVAIELGGFGGQTPVAIKVQARGAWTVRVIDMATMPSLRATTTTGRGPAVLLVPPNTLSGLSTYTFTHSGRANFIVDAYGDISGDTNLVNEIGHFSGEELIPSDTRIITIEADGAWSITAGK